MTTYTKGISTYSDEVTVDAWMDEVSFQLKRLRDMEHQEAYARHIDYGDLMRAAMILERMADAMVKDQFSC